MKQSYKSYVFVFSLYYVLIAFSLPLVYSVTYQVPFMDAYTIEWFSVILLLCPCVFLISAARYGYHRIKFMSQYYK